MASQRRRTEEKTYYYVDGNTVRKAAPVRELPRQPEQKPQRHADARTRRNREREKAMSLGHVLFLSAAIAVMAFVCGSLIYLQSEVSSAKSSVAALESELLDMQTDNEALEKRIDTSVQLNDIKNKAINELGMKYPTSDQIVYYTIDNKDYMEQYEDIPEK
jgi:cell division protein FtsL